MAASYPLNISWMRGIGVILVVGGLALFVWPDDQIVAIGADFTLVGIIVLTIVGLTPKVYDGIDEGKMRTYVSYRKSIRPVVVGSIAFWVGGTLTRLIDPSIYQFGASPMFYIGRTFPAIV